MPIAGSDTSETSCRPFMRSSVPAQSAATVLEALRQSPRGAQQSPRGRGRSSGASRSLHDLSSGTSVPPSPCGTLPSPRGESCHVAIQATGSSVGRRANVPTLKSTSAANLFPQGRTLMSGSQPNPARHTSSCAILGSPRPLPKTAKPPPIASSVFSGRTRPSSPALLTCTPRPLSPTCCLSARNPKMIRPSNGSCVGTNQHSKSQVADMRVLQIDRSKSSVVSAALPLGARRTGQIPLISDIAAKTDFVEIEKGQRKSADDCAMSQASTTESTCPSSANTPPCGPLPPPTFSLGPGCSLKTVRENLRLAQVEIALMQKTQRIEELEARVRQLQADGSECPQNQEFRFDDDLAAPVQLLIE